MSDEDFRGIYSWRGEILGKGMLVGEMAVVDIVRWLGIPPILIGFGQPGLKTQLAVPNEPRIARG